MNTNLLTTIHLANPWLKDPTAPIFWLPQYVPRIQFSTLQKQLSSSLMMLLTGPRQAGKTTLARRFCQELVDTKAYTTVLYLNCDEALVREWLTGSHVLYDIERILDTRHFILFIDEVQRLETPGLILKAIYDLHWPIKIIATGSSQLEIKSKVQEHLTGRHFEALILPLSCQELGDRWDFHVNTLYGSYPQIFLEAEKTLYLENLYKNYINKDIIEILQVRNADTMRHLLGLMAHAAGQLVNYQQLATDCRVSSPTIQHYLSILENTYVLKAITPFTGNKRTEITSNPIYYFLDNGFRNQALNNFSALENRTDLGLLIEGFVFQELYKLKIQYALDFEIHYWRTKSGAEVDFVLYKNQACFIPVEVKYRTFNAPKISRGFRSFLQSYAPKRAIIITKDWYGDSIIEGVTIHFVPFSTISTSMELVRSFFLSE